MNTPDTKSERIYQWNDNHTYAKCQTGPLIRKNTVSSFLQALDGLKGEDRQILQAAIKYIDGNYKDTERLREEIKKADFESVRGNFRFNNNN